MTIGGFLGERFGLWGLRFWDPSMTVQEPEGTP